MSRSYDNFVGEEGINDREHYHEDEDLGFFGNPLDSKEAMLTAIKMMSKKDIEWLKKQMEKIE